MLIYLDAMIVQHIADHADFIFQDIISDQKIRNPAKEAKLAVELEALSRLAFLEQFANWNFAASSHLLNELLSGKPTNTQHETYKILLQAWENSTWIEGIEADKQKVSSIEELLLSLNLKDKADRRHLAEAMTLGASWFLTNDKNIIKRTRQKQQEVKNLNEDMILDNPLLNANQKLKRLLEITTVARPSECVKEVEKYLTLM
jgi:hypothetical protein